MRKGNKSPNKCIDNCNEETCGENRSMKWKAPSFIKKGEEMEQVFDDEKCFQE